LKGKIERMPVVGSGQRMLKQVRGGIRVLKRFGHFEDQTIPVEVQLD
jgi:hypothetical protein